MEYMRAERNRRRKEESNRGRKRISTEEGGTERKERVEGNITD